jgi:peptide-methionine (R)-S-oxide reductase
MKKVRKSDAEWREQLSPMAYSVAREKATERAFSGNYWDHHEHGIYRCVGCGTPLFTSDTKFDSGCGWPSYFRAIDLANVREERDTSHGMTRTEIVCNVCDSHLGHVFTDGRRRPGCAIASTPQLTFEPRSTSRILNEAAV